MTKRHIVARIAVATGLSKAKVDQVLELFFDLVIDALTQKGRLELRNFAVLRTVLLPARVGHNPNTRSDIALPPTRYVNIRAGKRMLERLNP